MAIIRWKTGTLPDPWVGLARHWYDGDTLYVTDNPGRGTIRIFGIDAPEWGQAGAGAARDALRIATRQFPVYVKPTQLDRYGRIVATLVTHTSNDVGADLLRQGLVWWENRYAPHMESYKELQKTAREKQIGLWKTTPYAWAPWIWRRNHR